MLWLFVRPAGFACWISYAPVFGFVCCRVLVFALSPLLCLGLCVLGDGALVVWGSFMRARHLCVLVRIWAGGEVGAPLGRFRPSGGLFY